MRDLCNGNTPSFHVGAKGSIPLSRTTLYILLNDGFYASPDTSTGAGFRGKALLIDALGSYP